MPFFSRLPQVRPWPEFAESTRFSLPEQPKISERMSTNISYYAGNYLLIAAVLFAFTWYVKKNTKIF